MRIVKRFVGATLCALALGTALGTAVAALSGLEEWCLGGSFTTALQGAAVVGLVGAAVAFVFRSLEAA